MLLHAKAYTGEAYRLESAHEVTDLLSLKPAAATKESCVDVCSTKVSPAIGFCELSKERDILPFTALLCQYITLPPLGNAVTSGFEHEEDVQELSTRNFSDENPVSLQKDA